MKTVLQILHALLLTSLMATARAQEVLIPDSRLNAAIREALQKPSGPLTEQDLLSLTNLDAHGICVRDIGRGCEAWDGVKSLEGLEAAHNLMTLNLTDNQLTNVALLAGLTRLTALFLSGNQYTNFSFFERADESTGPPGAYTVINSADLAAWTALGTLTNNLGSVVFTDAAANQSPQKFYRARSAP